MKNINYFVGTENECNNFLIKINSILGYPNINTKTDTLTRVVKHKNKNKNKNEYYMSIKNTFFPALNRQTSDIDFMDNSTILEKSKFKDRDTLKNEGAF